MVLKCYGESCPHLNVFLELPVVIILFSIYAFMFLKIVDLDREQLLATVYICRKAKSVYKIVEDCNLVVMFFWYKRKNR